MQEKLTYLQSKLAELEGKVDEAKVLSYDCDSDLESNLNFIQSVVYELSYKVDDLLAAYEAEKQKLKQEKE